MLKGIFTVTVLGAVCGGMRHGKSYRSLQWWHYLGLSAFSIR